MLRRVTRTPRPFPFLSLLGPLLRPSSGLLAASLALAACGAANAQYAKLDAALSDMVDQQARRQLRSLAVEADVQRAIFLRLKGEPLQAARILEALLHAAAEPPPMPL